MHNRKGPAAQPLIQGLPARSRLRLPRSRGVLAPSPPPRFLQTRETGTAGRTNEVSAAGRQGGPAGMIVVSTTFTHPTHESSGISSARPPRSSRMGPAATASLPHSDHQPASFITAAATPADNCRRQFVASSRPTSHTRRQRIARANTATARQSTANEKLPARIFIPHPFKND